MVTSLDFHPLPTGTTCSSRRISPVRHRSALYILRRRVSSTFSQSPPCPFRCVNARYSEPGASTTFQQWTIFILSPGATDSLSRSQPRYVTLPPRSALTTCLGVGAADNVFSLRKPSSILSECSGSFSTHAAARQRRSVGARIARLSYTQ